MKAPPTSPCQMLVTMEGTSIKAIASFSPTVAASSASAIVGRPSPTTPFTQPANRKVAQTIATTSTVHMRGAYLRPNRRP